MELDVAHIRSSFPALGLGVAHFDGPGGTQVPREVADAVAAALTSGISNRGTVTAAERRADSVVAQARTAMADLVGGVPEGVVFARSMTQSTMDLARALSRDWAPGDEVVVTRLDHDANIRPWVVAAERVGATVRWAEFDKESAELTPEHVRDQLSERTRLVAVTGASNILGTRPDLPAIAAAVHEVGALLHVDGVHLTPHAPVDVAALGADLYACSPYKFLGPHCGVLVASPALLEQVRPDKLLPSSDAVPERFELGTLPYELLAGTTAAVDFLAALTSDAGDRRTRVRESMAAVEAHETRLFARLLDGLRGLDRVVLHGSPQRRTPTALFSVEGTEPAAVHRALAERGVNAPASHFYAIEAVRWMGLGDAGAVRAGLSVYTDDAEVDRLLTALAEVAR